MSDDKKPAPEREAQAREKELTDRDGLYNAIVNGRTDIGIGHSIRTGTITTVLSQSGSK